MGSYWLRDGLMAAAGLALGLFAFLLWEPEKALLALIVTPERGDLTDWLSEFDATQWVVWVGILCALVWHLITLVNTGRNGHLRRLWATLALMGCVLGLVFGDSQIPNAAQGRLLAVLLLPVNVLAAFWLATALTTPATHKYDPPGAGLRKRLGL